VKILILKIGISITVADHAHPKEPWDVVGITINVHTMEKIVTIVLDAGALLRHLNATITVDHAAS